MASKEDLIELAKIYATFFGKDRSERSQLMVDFERVEKSYCKRPAHSVYYLKYRELVQIIQFCDLDSVVSLMQVGSNFIYNATVMSIMANLDSFKAKLDQSQDFWTELLARETRLQDSSYFEVYKQNMQNLAHVTKISCEKHSLKELQQSKEAQALIHLMLMVIEPQQSPYYTNFVGVRVEGTSCYKAEYLHKVSVLMSEASDKLISKINLNKCTEDTFLELKELREEWIQNDLSTRNRDLLDVLINMLEVKYDACEEDQEGKQVILQVFNQANARVQLERYVEILDKQRDLILKLSSPWLPLMDRSHRTRDIGAASTTRYFDKLSTNALQNVMEYFETWGPDFIKMRSINKKTKNAYMAKISSLAKIENYLQTLEPAFVSKCKETLSAFKQKLDKPSLDQQETNVPSIFSSNQALDVETESRLLGIIKAPKEELLASNEEARKKKEQTHHGKGDGTGDSSDDEQGTSTQVVVDLLKNFRRFKVQVYRQFSSDVVLKRELTAKLKKASCGAEDTGLDVYSVPLKALEMIKLSKNAELKEAAAWIECAEQGSQLSEVSKKLFDLDRLNETQYFEVMKKLVM